MSQSGVRCNARGEHLRWSAPEQPPEVELACAVLALAVSDLRGNNPTFRGQAKVWFQGRSPWLKFWCDVSGVDAELVREKALSGDVGRIPQRNWGSRGGSRLEPPPEQLTLAF